MSDEDSELIVVDDSYDHETKETIKRLKEVIDLYKKAHGDLVKSHILLQDQLQLALQLVLQRIPPATESNVEELVESLSQSAYACNDEMRRDYVKSLCSKLIVVNAEYQKLAKEFEILKKDGVFSIWSKPKVERLRAVLQTMESMLLSPNDPGRSPNAVTVMEQLPKPAGDDLSELCALAERINFRLKAQLEEKALIEHCDTECEPIPLPTAGPSTTLCSEQEAPAAGMNQQAIVKMIQEEVSSVMQKEMQKALETHKNLIQSTLSVQNASTPATIAPASRLTAAAHDVSCQCSSSSGNIIFAPDVSGAISMQREESGPGFEVPSKTTSHATPPLPPPPPPPAEPTYTPEQEIPQCPACGLKCEHRFHLEDHLETCLSSKP